MVKRRIGITAIVLAGTMLLAGCGGRVEQESLTAGFTKRSEEVQAYADSETGAAVADEPETGKTDADDAGGGVVAQANGDADMLKTADGSWKRMVMLDGKLFVETGETHNVPRCGVMDGNITSTTNGEPPTEDNQSNFGKDIGFQYGMRENRIEICLDDGWRVFAYNENNLAGFSMTVRDVTADGCTVTFRNDTGNADRERSFGEAFRLETWDGESGCWSYVPTVVCGDFGFNEVAYPVAAGESRDWDVDWTWLYGSLKSGTYRIIKSVIVGDAAVGYEEYTLSQEFMIP